jgi:hypothetical protein
MSRKNYLIPRQGSNGLPNYVEPSCTLCHWPWLSARPLCKDFSLDSIADCEAAIGFGNLSCSTQASIMRIHCLDLHFGDTLQLRASSINDLFWPSQRCGSHSRRLRGTRRRQARNQTQSPASTGHYRRQNYGQSAGRGGVDYDDYRYGEAAHDQAPFQQPVRAF